MCGMQMCEFILMCKYADLSRMCGVQIMKREIVRNNAGADGFVNAVETKDKLMY